MNNQNEFYRGVEAACHAMARAGGAGEAATVALVHSAIDALAPAWPALAAACAAGCAHCCHFPVGITWPEVQALAAAIAPDVALRHAVLAAAADTAAAEWPQLVGVPCPLLVDGRCAAYAARPLPCRSLTSTDASACAAALTTPAVAVPRDEAAYWRGLGASHALAAANGLGVHELRSALAAVLQPSGDPRAAFAASRPAG